MGWDEVGVGVEVEVGIDEACVGAWLGSSHDGSATVEVEFSPMRVELSMVLTIVRRECVLVNGAGVLWVKCGEWGKRLIGDK